MAKSIDELKLTDEPLPAADLSTLPDPPPDQGDLIARAKAHAKEHRLCTSEKAVVAAYRAPEYLRFGIEALANEATSGAIDPAAHFLVELGLEVIREFEGVAEIAKARRIVLPKGNGRQVGWFNDFPVIDFFAEGTEDHKALRSRFDVSFVKELHNFARSVGLSASRLVLFCLMAGLVQLPSCSGRPFRLAMVKTLRQLRRAFVHRAREARQRAERIQARPDSDDDSGNLADVLRALEADGEWDDD